MKLSINMGNYTCRYGDGEAIDIVKAAGFDAMDWSLMDMVDDDAPFNGDDYREKALALRALCDEKQIPITQTHAPFSFPKDKWDDPEYFEGVIFPRMIRSLEISGILGAEVEVVHPIHNSLYKGHEEEFFQRNMAYYGRLIPYAEKYGVKIGVENMFQRDPLRGHIVADTCSVSGEFIRYLDTLNSPWITGCLDVGHVSLPISDETAADMIRALGHDRLGALHIHDNDYTRDQHALPYFGSLDWAEICKALGEIDYKGDFTYEVNGQLIFHVDEGFIPVGAKIMADVGKYLVSMVEANR